MKYRDKIISYFDNLPDGTVIIANDLYENTFNKMTQDAFFRAIERLASSHIITRVGKGMYVKGEDSDKNTEELLLNYFFGEDNSCGLYTGYELYNKYSLTEERDDEISLFSNKLRTRTCRIGRLYIRKAEVDLAFDNSKIIEALEILQNYDDIVGLNKIKFAKYAKRFSRVYDDDAAVTVIKTMKYKKCTIAFMKKILDMYKVNNTLQQFLSYSSDYKIPPIQRIAR